MGGKVPKEVEELLSSAGILPVGYEIEPIVRRQVAFISQKNLFPQDENFLAARDVFIGAMAWRLLDNLSDLNATKGPPPNKLNGFLYLAFYLCKVDGADFEKARARAHQLASSSEELGTIAHFIATKTHDSATIGDSFLSQMVSEIQQNGSFPIMGKRDGRITVGFERLARLAGWVCGGVGALLGVAVLSKPNDLAIVPAIITGGVLGFFAYGAVKSISWVIKGFLTDAT